VLFYIDLAIGIVVVPVLYWNSSTSVLCTNNPFAGSTIAWRSLVVSRGIKIPLSVVDAYSTEEESGVVVFIPTYEW